jgi:hypothetical protein
MPEGFCYRQRLEKNVVVRVHVREEMNLACLAVFKKNHSEFYIALLLILLCYHPSLLCQ